jgi:hypothetical protein
MPMNYSTKYRYKISLRISMYVAVTLLRPE